MEEEEEAIPPPPQMGLRACFQVWLQVILLCVAVA